MLPNFIEKYKLTWKMKKKWVKNVLNAVFNMQLVKFEEKKRMTDFSCKFFFPFYRMKKKMSLFIFKNLSNFCFHHLYFVWEKYLPVMMIKACLFLFILVNIHELYCNYIEAKFRIKKMNSHKIPSAWVCMWEHRAHQIRITFHSLNYSIQHWLYDQIYSNHSIVDFFLRPFSLFAR
jgi:hypothetical protein